MENGKLMEQGAVKRSSRDHPRLRPLRVVRDKGYTGWRIRNYLRRRGIITFVFFSELDLLQKSLIPHPQPLPLPRGGERLR